MNSRTILFSCIIAVIYAVFFPQFAHAVSAIAVSPSSDGNFVLQGVGIENAAALEIILQYDSTSLSNPRVVQGGLIAGALMAVNPNVPGILRIAIIRTTPITGNGAIALLSFDRKGSSVGNILSMNVRLADIAGGPLPALVRIVNSPDPTPTTSTSSQNQGTGPITGAQADAGGSSTPATIPSVIMVTGSRERSDDDNSVSDASRARKEVAQPVIPEIDQEQGMQAKTADKTPTRKDLSSETREAGQKIYTHKSVLDHFREFNGDRTPASFIALFKRDSLIGFRQYPPVALSDGKTMVRVTFISTPGNKIPADVAVMGARLVSMTTDPDNTNTWIVELSPEKGTLKASVAVSQEGMKMVFPLTIAPKVGVDLIKSGEATEADFKLFLKKRDMGNASHYDLNGDGKRDYLDDYIFTANYLTGDKK